MSRTTSVPMPDGSRRRAQPGTSPGLVEAGGSEFGQNMRQATVARFGDPVVRGGFGNDNFQNDAFQQRQQLLVGQNAFGVRGAKTLSQAQSRIRGALAAYGSSGAMVFLILFCMIAVVAVIIVAATTLPSVLHANQAGCTFDSFDNYQRGFGIDNGSCAVEHRGGVVEFCSDAINTTAVYALGGSTETNTTRRDANGKTLEFTSLADGKSICLDFTKFILDGGNTLTVENSRDDAVTDGIFASPPLLPADMDAAPSRILPRQKICGKSGRGAKALSFTLETDADEGNAEWTALIECGVPGCTHDQFSNYDPLATIDDRTCYTRMGDVPSISFCSDALFYDSGGADGGYGNNEFRGIEFLSSDAEKIVCFEFTTFSMANEGSGPCNGDQFIIDNGQNIDNGQAENPNRVYCNNNGQDLMQLGTGRVCSKLGESIRFRFLSNDADTAAGWSAYATCVSPP